MLYRLSWVAVFLLVLLRLGIGWHFLFEGANKLRSESWSAEPYLRESTGPLAPAFRKMAGDSLVDKLTPRKAEGAADPTKVAFAKRFPEALEKEWDAWFERFVNHYELSEEQRKKAGEKLQKHKEAMARWIVEGEETVTTPASVGPEFSVAMTVRERIDAYHKALSKARDFQERELGRTAGTLFEDETSAHLLELKADAARFRAGLSGDLHRRTRAMQRDVKDVLVAEQIARPKLSDSLGLPVWERDVLGWIDFLMPWALAVVGVCLIVGFFTRTACVVGALLLLSFYLAMPPWPGVPANPLAEGYYFIVNKNLIEMLALLALATTRSGYWAGLDGLLQYLNPWNYRKARGQESGVRGQEPKVKHAEPARR